MKCWNCGHSKNRDFQYCRRCLANLYPQAGFNITLGTPPWLAAQHTLSKQGKVNEGVEAYHEVRTETLKKDKRARAWEEGRKAEMVRNKPAWVKKGRNISDIL